MQVARLSADNLACRRGDRVLFAGLSITLESGAALHVTGPNGTGKTSLIRLLAGLLRPFAGTVTRKGDAGLVDERPALDPHADLASALRFWSRLDGAPDTNDIQQMLGLAELGDVPVRFLSTGQRKRAAFARLMGQDAQIWLLDEPLNGLDMQAQSTVERLIETHRAAGGIAIIASHQPIALGDAVRLDLPDYAP